MGTCETEQQKPPISPLNIQNNKEIEQAERKRKKQEERVKRIQMIEEAIQYLNLIRDNPDKFSSQIGVSLSHIQKKKALIKNQILCSVAQEKAEDMAKRNYFGHVNPQGKGINIFIHKAGYELYKSWLNKPENNSFESLSAGCKTPKQGIKQLLNDNNEVQHLKAGHRVHLLGINDFWSDCEDIGIGFAHDSNSQYKSYLCVIIAKHSF